MINTYGWTITDGDLDCSATNICSDTAIWTASGQDISPQVPTSNTSVIIMADYNTVVVGASIDACEVTVNAGVTLTIAADDYLNVANSIIVDGILNVEHTANIVQINDDATVTNNGTINVYVDTPALDGLDFMLMGSPMSMETRLDVFNDAQRVRNHLTENFTPNASVMAA